MMPLPRDEVFREPQGVEYFVGKNHRQNVRPVGSELIPVAQIF